ncbi:uncharacterized protein LOC116553132 [Sapajus apella]|uniref:Uncharacterized protein LOC116553132 n=1 Tax=Sapajus apella TaxID=9515 RepID=A0A6J3I100_SAPAP|nr:uncharacterized protein LOC116553132 [Sapajus apella]
MRTRRSYLTGLLPEQRRASLGLGAAAVEGLGAACPGAPGAGAEPHSWDPRRGTWMARREGWEENCEFSGPRPGRGAEHRPNRHPTYSRRNPPFLPGPIRLAFPPTAGLSQPGLHLKGPGSIWGADSRLSSQPLSPLPPAEWVLLGGVLGWGGGDSPVERGEEAPAAACLCPCPVWGWSRILAHLESSGLRDTPEKPKPGGHRLMLELPVGGGITKAKPPREFPFGNLETAPFMTFSRVGGRGTGWVYRSDTIYVMTSAPARPLSNVNSWKGPEPAWSLQVSKALGPGLGQRACLSWDGVCWFSKVPECLSHGWAGVQK